MVGSGAAGLAVALAVGDIAKVFIVTQGDLRSGSTPQAQGGIAAVLDGTSDNPSVHVQDTFIAGDELGSIEAIKFVTSSGQRAIEWLIEQGIHFDKTRNTEPEAATAERQPFSLAQEGGHSCRRILHSGDTTGKLLSQVLLERARAHPNITSYSHCHLVTLLKHQGDLPSTERKIIGAQFFNNVTGESIAIYAKKNSTSHGRRFFLVRTKHQS